MLNKEGEKDINADLKYIQNVSNSVVNR